VFEENFGFELNLIRDLILFIFILFNFIKWIKSIDAVIFLNSVKSLIDKCIIRQSDRAAPHPSAPPYPPPYFIHIEEEVPQAQKKRGRPSKK
jgi:hypothetical protein